MTNPSLQYLSHIPAAPPPDGVVSNFSDPPSQKKPIFIVNGVFIPLMVISVAIRIYTRKYISGSLGWDDFFCVLAMFGACAHAGLDIYLLNLGLGVHMWDIPAINITKKVAHEFTALGVIYGPIILFVKLSILLLYFRVFSVSKVMRYLIYFAIILQVIFYVTYTAFYSAVLASCGSASDIFKKFCTQEWRFTVAQGTINVATDFYILLLPIGLMWQLQLNLSRKIGVIAIFMTGLVACIVSVVRLVLISRNLHSLDIFWNAAATSLLSTIEMNAGIISASMPAMPLFFRRHNLILPMSHVYRKLHRSHSRLSSTPRKDFQGISLNMTTPNLHMDFKGTHNSDCESKVVDTNETLRGRLEK